MMLNTATGTLDPATLRFTPGPFTTPRTSTEWQPDATAPEWIRMVERVFADPEAVQRAVRNGIMGQPSTLVLTDLQSEPWGPFAWQPFIDGLRAALGMYAVGLAYAPSEGGLSRAAWHQTTEDHARVSITLPVKRDTRISAAEMARLASTTAQTYVPWSRQAHPIVQRTGLLLVPSARRIKGITNIDCHPAGSYQPTHEELPGILRWCIDPGQRR